MHTKRHPCVVPAFSLVELLVVISIVAILIGILLPSLSAVRMAARRTACSSNLRQIGIALASYEEDFQQLMPVARYMPDPFITAFPDDPSLPQALDNYMPVNSGVYHCPGDDKVHARSGSSYTYNTSLGGRTIDQVWLVRRMGFQRTQVPVAYDADGHTFALQGGEYITVGFFHRRRNLLFADGHVGDFVEVPTEPVE